MENVVTIVGGEYQKVLADFIEGVEKGTLTEQEAAEYQVKLELARDFFSKVTRTHKGRQLTPEEIEKCREAARRIGNQVDFHTRWMKRL